MTDRAVGIILGIITYIFTWDSMTNREWKKSLYIDWNAVDMLKELIEEGFYYKWIKLITIWQVITALVNEYKENKKN